MSVYKPVKSRYFHFDFQFKGRRFHGSTGVETRRAAEAVERRFRSLAALGQLGDGAGATLDEAAGRWWAEVGRHLKTAGDAERRTETLIRLLGKATPLAEISTGVIARAIERRRGEAFTKRADRKGDPAPRHALANATVNAEFVTHLRRILTRARKVWQIPGLPAIDWNSLRLTEPRPQPRTYTAAQRAAWRAQCDPTAAFALDLLLTYGLRFGELFFPPAAFDPDGPRLLIAGASRKKDVVHLVPLRRDHARQIAARAGRASAARLPSIWFEADRAGRLHPVTYYGLQARLRSAAGRAGIDVARLLHGARHHVGMTILRQTGNLRLTQQLLGHADIKSTLIYASALEADLRAALDPAESATTPARVADSKSRNSPEPAAAAAAFSVAPQRRAARRPPSS
ncbi:MAG: site-specific integrase [Caulobacter sp.]|nr:site-specific integrase [Caulobacter sp.]